MSPPSDDFTDQRRDAATDSGETVRGEPTPPRPVGRPLRLNDLRKLYGRMNNEAAPDAREDEASEAQAVGTPVPAVDLPPPPKPEPPARNTSLPATFYRRGSATQPPLDRPASAATVSPEASPTISLAPTSPVDIERSTTPSRPAMPGSDAPSPIGAGVESFGARLAKLGFKLEGLSDAPAPAPASIVPPDGPAASNAPSAPSAPPDGPAASSAPSAPPDEPTSASAPPGQSRPVWPVASAEADDGRSEWTVDTSEIPPPAPKVEAAVDAPATDLVAQLARKREEKIQAAERAQQLELEEREAESQLRMSELMRHEAAEGARRDSARREALEADLSRSRAEHEARLADERAAAEAEIARRQAEDTERRHRLEEAIKAADEARALAEQRVVEAEARERASMEQAAEQHRQFLTEQSERAARDEQARAARQAEFEAELVRMTEQRMAEIEASRVAKEQALDVAAQSKLAEIGAQEQAAEKKLTEAALRQRDLAVRETELNERARLAASDVSERRSLEIARADLLAQAKAAEESRLAAVAEKAAAEGARHTSEAALLVSRSTMEAEILRAQQQVEQQVAQRLAEMTAAQAELERERRDVAMRTTMLAQQALDLDARRAEAESELARIERERAEIDARNAASREDLLALRESTVAEYRAGQAEIVARLQQLTEQSAALDAKRSAIELQVEAKHEELAAAEARLESMRRSEATKSALVESLTVSLAEAEMQLVNIERARGEAEALLSRGADVSTRTRAEQLRAAVIKATDVVRRRRDELERARSAAEMARAAASHEEKSVALVASEAQVATAQGERVAAEQRLASQQFTEHRARSGEISRDDLADLIDLDDLVGEVPPNPSQLVRPGVLPGAVAAPLDERVEPTSAEVTAMFRKTPGGAPAAASDEPPVAPLLSVPSGPQSLAFASWPELDSSATPKAEEEDGPISTIAGRAMPRPRLGTTARDQTGPGAVPIQPAAARRSPFEVPPQYRVERIHQAEPSPVLQDTDPFRTRALEDQVVFANPFGPIEDSRPSAYAPTHEAFDPNRARRRRADTNWLPILAALVVIGVAITIWWLFGNSLGALLNSFMRSPDTFIKQLISALVGSR